MKPTGKRKEKADFVAIAEMVNLCRKEVGPEVMSVKQLHEHLKGILPVNPCSLSDFAKVGVIVRTSRGYYMFPKEPVCWTKVRDYYALLRRRNRKYELRRQEKRRVAKAQEAPVKEAPTVTAEGYTPSELTINDAPRALALLKSLGYIVLRMM